MPITTINKMFHNILVISRFATNGVHTDIPYSKTKPKYTMNRIPDHITRYSYIKVSNVSFIFYWTIFLLHEAFMPKNINLMHVWLRKGTLCIAFWPWEPWISQKCMYPIHLRCQHDTFLIGMRSHVCAYENILYKFWRCENVCYTHQCSSIL